jgi:hypothetical protein
MRFVAIEGAVIELRFDRESRAPSIVKGRSVLTHIRNRSVLLLKNEHFVFSVNRFDASESNVWTPFPLFVRQNVAVQKRHVFRVLQESHPLKEFISIKFPRGHVTMMVGAVIAYETGRPVTSIGSISERQEPNFEFLEDVIFSSIHFALIICIYVSSEMIGFMFFSFDSFSGNKCANPEVLLDLRSFQTVLQTIKFLSNGNGDRVSRFVIEALVWQIIFLDRNESEQTETTEFLLIVFGYVFFQTETVLQKCFATSQFCLAPAVSMNDEPITTSFGVIVQQFSSEFPKGTSRTHVKKSPGDIGSAR